MLHRFFIPLLRAACPVFLTNVDVIHLRVITLMVVFHTFARLL
jgi:hypothetical protein